MNILHTIIDKSTAAVKRAVKHLPSRWRGKLCIVMTLSILATSFFVNATVRIRTATITDGTQTHVITTLSLDPHAVIAQAGVEVSPEDEVTHEIDGATFTIEIARAFDIPITMEGETGYVSVTGGTVAEAIRDAGITLSDEDELNLDPEALVDEDTEIEIIRTRYLEYDEIQTIAHSTDNVYTKKMRIGKTKVTTEGVDGEKAVTYRVKIVDGEIVDTQIVGEVVTKKAVTEIKKIGTNGTIPLSESKETIELDAKGQPVKYKKVLTGKCTAYSSEEGTVGTVTSTGMKAQVGVVAVNPKVIPYGTKLYIVSPDGKYVYGYAIAGDTGGGVMKNVLLADLFMDTIYECKQFGRRTMNVYILE